jgi:hypothetical protein
VEGFDPENPSPEDLPEVGNFFASGESAAEDAIDQLRELSPPADIEAKVDALVMALEQQLENAKAQASAARAGAVGAFTATLDDASSSLEAVQEPRMIWARNAAPLSCPARGSGARADPVGTVVLSAFSTRLSEPEPTSDDPNGVGKPEAVG